MVGDDLKWLEFLFERQNRHRTCYMDSNLTKQNIYTFEKFHHYVHSHRTMMLMMTMARLSAYNLHSSSRDEQVSLDMVCLHSVGVSVLHCDDISREMSTRG